MPSGRQASHSILLRLLIPLDVNHKQLVSPLPKVTFALILFQSTCPKKPPHSPIAPTFPPPFPFQQTRLQYFFSFFHRSNNEAPFFRCYTKSPFSLPYTPSPTTHSFTPHHFFPHAAPSFLCGSSSLAVCSVSCLRDHLLSRAGPPVFFSKDRGFSPAFRLRLSLAVFPLTSPFVRFTLPSFQVCVSFVPYTIDPPSRPTDPCNPVSN